MNWDALGALSELIAAAAVVLSLGYVAIQLRRARVELQTNTRQAVLNTFLEFQYAIVGDGELAHLFHRGIADLSVLTPPERSRFMHIAYAYLKVFENTFLHKLDDTLQAEVWESNLPILSAYAASPGFREYWTRRRAAFDPRFIAVLESLPDVPLEAPVEVAVGRRGEAGSPVT